MHGAIEGNLGFADGRPGRAPGSRDGQSPLEAETAARAEALARRIREHRQAFACSQQEFAQESGISRATLSKIEQGHIYPSMQVRKKLAKALGVGPQELWNMRAGALTDESKKQVS
jgi:DNA-binding XRE family transcriptional regulator